jgi:hypothetical protein
MRLAGAALLLLQAAAVSGFWFEDFIRLEGLFVICTTNQSESNQHPTNNAMALDQFLSGLCIAQKLTLRQQ